MNKLALPKFTQPTSLEKAAFFINKLGKNIHEHAYIVGKILLWVKIKGIKYGEFGYWIEKNVWFSQMTAERFINFAKKCDEKKQLLLYAPKIQNPHGVDFVFPINKIVSLEIRKGDFKEVLADLENIDAIITDPPYAEKYLNCYSELAEFASKKLKQDGFLAAYSGQYNLPEVIKRLSEHLTYVWTFCLYHTGKKQLVNGVNIMCGWKPVLIFSKGNKKMRFTAYDVLISEKMEKENHKWQQSESGVKPLIEIFSKPGELVVDPFAGSGTFLKVAEELNRRAIGAEIQ